MKILVPVKRVLDYNVKPRVKADGTGVDLANVKMSMNPFDEIGVEEAISPEGKGRRDRDRRRQSSVPAKAQETLRTALAMGADRAILVQTDDAVEPLALAKIFKAIADAEQPGLVILGKQAIDDDNNQTGQMLAALTGWAQGTFASAVNVDGDQRQCDARSRRRSRNGEAQASRDRHHRPSSERAALRLAAEHHEGEVEAARYQDPRRLRRRHRAAREGGQGQRTRRPLGRRSRSPMSMNWLPS